MARALVLGVLLAGGFGLFGHTAFWLARYVRMGKEQSLPIALGDRVKSFLVFVIGQARVISEPAGILHLFIFWGFLILQLETIEYFIRGFYWKFHLSMFVGEGIYNFLLFLQDMAGILIIGALVIASYRRFVLRPKHSLPSMDAAIINALIIGLMLTKFLANGAEIAFMPVDQLGHNPSWTPAALATSYIFANGPGSNVGSSFLWTMYNIGYWGHIAIVLFFLNYIPFGKHLHLLGAMPNVFFRKLEPKGALYPIDLENAFDEDGQAIPGMVGAKEVEELTWKQLLDTYACTECGRCEHYCPAYNTGKPLNPMSIIHNVKEHLREKGEHTVQKGKSLEEPWAHKTITEAHDNGGLLPKLVGGVITREEIWACTTCGACVGNCPVFIEHVDTIIDMRRYLTMVEGDLSPEVTRTFRNIDTNSNPWGLSPSYRGDWADGLDIPTLKELDYTPEYLFFVGCSGSFDDRQKKVTKSLARILKAANVDFAILGGEEKCTGDPVRRLGNEYSYKMCATENIETLNRYQVTKIITACPHCFHTIGKEYPQLGGNYEVLHHTEVIADLMRTGRIQMEPGEGEKITYHDSCYIGRWADIYDPPRDIIENIPNVERVEMTLAKKQSFCCGAGGGRMWMEEDLGKRVNLERTDQALEVEPDVIAVACPFCMTMFDEGVKNREADQVELLDLAEIVDRYLITEDAAPATGDNA